MNYGYTTKQHEQMCQHASTGQFVSSKLAVVISHSSKAEYACDAGPVQQCHGVQDGAEAHAGQGGPGHQDGRPLQKAPGNVLLAVATITPAYPHLHTHYLLAGASHAPNTQLGPP